MTTYKLGERTDRNGHSLIFVVPGHALQVIKVFQKEQGGTLTAHRDSNQFLTYLLKLTKLRAQDRVGANILASSTVGGSICPLLGLCNIL